MLCYALIPVGAFVVLSRLRPVWQDRYVFLALPGLVLLLAWVLTELHRGRRAALAAALAVLSVLGLSKSPYSHHGGGWRAVAEGVEKVEREAGTEDGVIIVTDPSMSGLLGYYHRAGLPVVALLEAQGAMGATTFVPIDAAAVDAAAARTAGKAVALVLYPPLAGFNPESRLRVARRLAEQRGPGRLTDLGEARLYAFAAERGGGR